jgi:hypothetical protein
VIPLKNLNKMNREIKYIVIHRVDTMQLENCQFSLKTPCVHLLVDRNGYCERKIGFNFILDYSVSENDNAIHIGFLTDRKNGFPSANPLQFHVLYEKIEELTKTFSKALVVGADWFFEEETKAIGFEANNWFGSYGRTRENWIFMEDPENENFQDNKIEHLKVVHSSLEDQNSLFDNLSPLTIKKSDQNQTDQESCAGM